MTVPAFRDKFVGFVDILGFKDLVEAAEHGASGKLGDLIGLMQDLGTTDDKSAVDKNGPSTCPTSQRLAFNVDFELTQVSDCVVVSAEISPGGVLQVIDHCWLAATKLLTKGVAVRGFITRGSVLHEGNTILGTGYQNAYARERGVTAFKIEAEERGTPFIEIDGTVTKYIQTETDPCVREMVARMTESDGEISAIYPFKSFVHSYVISGGQRAFDPDNEKEANNNVRLLLQRFKADVEKRAHPTSAEAQAKIQHYLAALDRQLATVDRTDERIDWLSQPASPTYY